MKSLVTNLRSMALTLPVDLRWSWTWETEVEPWFGGNKSITPPPPMHTCSWALHTPCTCVPLLPAFSWHLTLGHLKVHNRKWQIKQGLPILTPSGQSQLYSLGWNLFLFIFSCTYFYFLPQPQLAEGKLLCLSLRPYLCQTTIQKHLLLWFMYIYNQQKDIEVKESEQLQGFPQTFSVLGLRGSFFSKALLFPKKCVFSLKHTL